MESQCDDTVSVNQFKDGAVYLSNSPSVRVNEGDSFETTVCRRIENSPELPVEPDSPVQNSPLDTSVDEQTSEVMEPGKKMLKFLQMNQVNVLCADLKEPIDAQDCLIIQH